MASCFITGLSGERAILFRILLFGTELFARPSQCTQKSYCRFVTLEYLQYFILQQQQNQVHIAMVGTYIR